MHEPKILYNREKTFFQTHTLIREKENLWASKIMWILIKIFNVRVLSFVNVRNCSENTTVSPLMQILRARDYFRNVYKY